MECQKCGKPVEDLMIDKESRLVCEDCNDPYEKEKEETMECSMCGKPQERVKNDNLGALVCDDCYDKHMVEQGTCDDCGKVVPIINLITAGAGQEICPQCAYRMALVGV